METKLRKIDRRTLYTMEVIKNAFLELEDEMLYDKINVTKICKQAQISRATFYLHYESIDDVLDSVIDDALLFSESAPGNLVDVLDVIKAGDIDKLRDNEAILPACQRIADSDKYHKLFMDPTLSEHIIHRIAEHEHDTVVPPLMHRAHLSEGEAEMIFHFILYGSFNVNRCLGWEKNEKWMRYQTLLSRFINAGMDALGK